jgi:hypothetical protein
MEFQKFISLASLPHFRPTGARRCANVYLSWVKLMDLARDYPHERNSPLENRKKATAELDEREIK